MTGTSREILDRALKAQEINPIDYHFGCFLAAHDRDNNPLPAVLGALASNYLALGHSCMPLSVLPELSSTWARFGLPLPDSGELRKILGQSSVCGQAGSVTPLVLDEDNLFLHKYRGFEVVIAEALISRLTVRQDIDTVALKQRLDNYFGEPGDFPDWQRVAASIALTRNLAIIAGGPGTGKTTTVVRILALLLEDDPQCRIRMAAPTGKAAMRLSTSVSQAVDKLVTQSEAVRASIPVGASTIHRLLGVNPSRELNRFHAGNRLPVDVMIVDEASMMDITLMQQLVCALPDECRLILLGDKDQLPSIEAGSVLADLCEQASNQYSPVYHELLAALGNSGLPEGQPPSGSLINDCTCNLQISHRFPDLSTIGQLARAINSNDQDATRILVDLATDAPGEAEFRFRELAGTQLPLGDIADGYRAFLATRDNSVSTPLDTIKAFSTYQVLCGVRQGPVGVEQINSGIEQALKAAGLLGSARWYHGRPILVTQNDYGLNLFNGDVGITLLDVDGDATVYFQSGDDSVRKVLPARLPAHETCWAMTIHKTQGSEFDRIAIVLPDRSHLLRLEFLSRELLYTAVTRARQQVTVYGYSNEFDGILARSARRCSGLAQRLQGKQN